MSLLAHSSEAVVEAAAAALQNLTCDSPSLRLAVVDEGAITLLVQLLEASGEESVQKHAAGVLHNLAITRASRRQITAAGAVEPLAKLMDTGSSAVQSAAGSVIGKLVLEPAARMALHDSNVSS